MHDPNRLVRFGEVQKRGATTQFGIKEADRSRHIYVIGKTGSGKSKLLEIFASQDIINGEGLIFMDPHGQSAEEMLEYIPEERIKDTIYFAPHLYEFPIGLNIMEDIGYDRRHLVVSSLMAAFHKIWGQQSWSDRMSYILGNTLLALLEYPDSTLLDISRMYNNKLFRKRVIENLKDPQVKKYWIEDFEKYSERYIQDATPAIQNKIGQFTQNPLVRNIIGQKKSAINFREVMDNKKILLVNLPKGQIGEDNAKILGILFTTKIYLDALSRSDLTKEELAAIPPCNFIVDEFQSFANSTFGSILSEARKYKLNLLLAHQYIGQLYSDEDVGGKDALRDAVFGNVGTFIVFRVGPLDAEIIAKQFAPIVTEEDLVSQPNRHMYLTLNIDGTGSQPFSAQTVDITPPPEKSYVEEIIKHSQMTYGVPRAEIEEEIKNKLEGDWKEEAEEHKKASAAGQGGGKNMGNSRFPKRAGNTPQHTTNYTKNTGQNTRWGGNRESKEGFPQGNKESKGREGKEGFPQRNRENGESFPQRQEKEKTKQFNQSTTTAAQSTQGDKTQQQTQQAQQTKNQPQGSADTQQTKHQSQEGVDTQQTKHQPQGGTDTRNNRKEHPPKQVVSQKQDWLQKDYTKAIENKKAIDTYVQGEHMSTQEKKEQKEKLRALIHEAKKNTVPPQKLGTQKSNSPQKKKEEITPMVGKDPGWFSLDDLQKSLPKQDNRENE